MKRNQPRVRASNSFKYGLMLNDLVAPESLGDDATTQQLQVWKIKDGKLKKTNDTLTVKQHFPNDKIDKGTLVLCQFILGSWTIVWMSCDTFLDELEEE